MSKFKKSIDNTGDTASDNEEEKIQEDMCGGSIGDLKESSLIMSASEPDLSNGLGIRDSCAGGTEQKPREHDQKLISSELQANLPVDQFGGGSVIGQKQVHESYELVVRRPQRKNEKKVEYVVTVTPPATAQDLLKRFTDDFNLDIKWWGLYVSSPHGKDLRELRSDENLINFRNQRIYLYPKTLAK